MGGKREKLLLEKVGRKGEGGTADSSQSFFVLHLLSRSLGRFDVFLLAQYKKGPMGCLRLQPCKQIEPFLYATLVFQGNACRRCSTSIFCVESAMTELGRSCCACSEVQVSTQYNSIQLKTTQYNSTQLKIKTIFQTSLKLSFFRSFPLPSLAQSIFSKKQI